jgi:hypothetical protein
MKGNGPPGNGMKETYGKKLKRTVFTQCRFPFTSLYKRKIIFIRGEREGWEGKTERWRKERRRNKKASMFYKSITRAYT